MIRIGKPARGRPTEDKNPDHVVLRFRGEGILKRFDVQRGRIKLLDETGVVLKVLRAINFDGVEVGEGFAGTHPPQHLL